MAVNDSFPSLYCYHSSVKVERIDLPNGAHSGNNRIVNMQYILKARQKWNAHHLATHDPTAPIRRSVFGVFAIRGVDNLTA
jgi:hypothetical protein